MIVYFRFVGQDIWPNIKFINFCIRRAVRHLFTLKWNFEKELFVTVAVNAVAHKIYIYYMPLRPVSQIAYRTMYYVGSCFAFRLYGNAFIRLLSDRILYLSL